MRPNLPGRLGVACLLVLVTGGVRSAQQRPTFRAGVDLVQIDVVVVDAGGRPIRGLTAADFEVVDRGVIRPVATFAEVSHEGTSSPDYPDGVPSDVASNQSATSERLVVLLVDDLHVRDRTEDVKGLLRPLVRGLGGDVSLGLVTTSGAYGVEVTDDRSRVLAEIERFEDKYDPGRGPADLGTFFGAIGTYKVVEDVARMVGADDGRRKAFVWVSTGVPSAGSLRSLLDGESCTGDAYHCGSLAGMLDALRRSSVAVYTIHPGGPQDKGQPLTLLADATGGFGVRPTDLEAGLARVISDLDNYYLLGFYPDDARDVNYSGVEVRVARPGATVRHRRGYSPRGAFDPPKNRDPLHALVAGVMPNTGLPLRLQAVPLLTTGSKAQVAVTLEIDLEALPEVPAGETFDDTLRYGIFAADLGRKKVAAGRHRTLQMRWRPVDVARPGAQRFLASNVLDLPPGRYQLRASAISSGLERSGSVYLLVDVPDLGRDEVTVGGLAMAVAGREADHPKVIDSVTRPNWPLPFRPSLERTFTAGDTLRVFFQIRRTSARVPAQGVAAIVDASGREVMRRTFDITGDRLTEHDLTLPLAGLAPGGYAVEVSAIGAAHQATQRVGIVVREAG